MPSVRNLGPHTSRDYFKSGYLESSYSSTDTCSKRDRYPNTDSYRPSWDSSKSNITSYTSSSTFSRWTTRYAPYAPSSASSCSSGYSCRSQTKHRFRTTESELDYYTRTAPRKYRRHISRHSGIVDSSDVLEHTCAETLPGQKTCMHASTTAGDIVNYIPMGNPDDVPGDAGPSRLSMHFMVLLPKYYKPVGLQSDKAYHAALVITKNPIGPSTLVAPQPGSDSYKANNIPYLQTLVFDAHSQPRRLVIDDVIEKKWQWKENTSIGYQIKIVHQDNLHAVIYYDHPTYGLRLSDGGYQQVLSHLGEEDDELEHAREVRNVEFWGKADTSHSRRKSSHRDIEDWLTKCKARRDEWKRKFSVGTEKR
ncbi:MAG: hypothetical protein L6R39_004166 [Caloplaca ligustica]|nr:MAG: hypothetical protein L6R39_004166 [Caloplaca ligustica]